ncbi:MAG: TetR/AcrR family transcriptional regulator [Acidimicrobiales bacterium]
MPRIVDREMRREEVLEATWRVLARGGIEGLNIREVAAEAGYSTGVVAHYFKNKDDVVRSALLRVWRRESERIAERTASLHGLAALDAIAAEVLPVGEQRSLEMAVWMSFWAAAIGDKELAAEQQKYYAGWRALLRRHLEEAVHLEEVADIDCHLEAVRLAALIDGVGIQAAFEPGLLEERDMVRLVRGHLRNLARSSVPAEGRVV